MAIPINDVIAISKQIRAGTGSATIHIGATGVLGILVADTGGSGWRAHQAHRQSAAAPGAVIAGLVPGSAAGQAGLAARDVIVSVDGTTVASPSALITALTTHQPKDTVQVKWVDTAGQQHTATVALAPGPPS